jgi:hypothetical protein
MMKMGIQEFLMIKFDKTDKLNNPFNLRLSISIK